VTWEVAVGGRCCRIGWVGSGCVYAINEVDDVDEIIRVDRDGLDMENASDNTDVDVDG
jgi:hypothetical protein